MALSASQKHEVLYRLGWEGKTLDVGSTSYSKIIADRLDNLSTPMQSTVIGILKRLAAIQTQMDEARCRLSASQVDNIKMNKDELRCLKQEFTRYVRELSAETCISNRRRGGVLIGVTN